MTAGDKTNELLGRMVGFVVQSVNIKIDGTSGQAWKTKLSKIVAVHCTPLEALVGTLVYATVSGATITVYSNSASDTDKLIAVTAFGRL